MNVLGLGGSIHDFATCLMQNGNVSCYIEDERILRKKNAFYKGVYFDLIKKNASLYCLQDTNLDFDDIELIVANDILTKYYYQKIINKAKKFELINHHLSHMYSTFYPSGFDEAAILVIDGGGSPINEKDSIIPLEVCSFGIGSNQGIKVLETLYGKRFAAEPYENKINPVIDCIGAFYGVLTNASGFTFLNEGKTMGLAPYGTDKLLKKMLSFTGFGKNGSFLFSLEGIEHLLKLREEWACMKNEEQQFAFRADIAWAGQEITERAYIHAAQYLKKITNLNKLCIAGGVALNSVANYKLYKTGLFEEIYIQPAAGDNGTAIGAAYYGWEKLIRDGSQSTFY